MVSSYPADRFAGPKPGFYFGTNDDGLLGYHRLRDPARRVAAPGGGESPAPTRTTLVASAERGTPRPYLLWAALAGMLVLLVVVCVVVV